MNQIRSTLNYHEDLMYGSDRKTIMWAHKPPVVNNDKEEFHDIQTKLPTKRIEQ